MVKAYTDLPFTELGDIESEIAPIREVTPLSYDGNKYCLVEFEGTILHMKAGYLYVRPDRLYRGHAPELF